MPAGVTGQALPPARTNARACTVAPAPSRLSVSPSSRSVSAWMPSLRKVAVSMRPSKTVAGAALPRTASVAEKRWKRCSMSRLAPSPHHRPATRAGTIQR